MKEVGSHPCITGSMADELECMHVAVGGEGGGGALLFVMATEVLD